MLKIHLYSINDSHKGKERVNEKTICLDLVKIYGNKPRTLLNKIRANKEIKINEFPKLFFELPIKSLNSL